MAKAVFVIILANNFCHIKQKYCEYWNIRVLVYSPKDLNKNIKKLKSATHTTPDDSAMEQISIKTKP